MPGCLLHPCSCWSSMFCAEPSKPASLMGVSVLYIALCTTGWAELLLAHYVLVDGLLGTCWRINCQQSQQLDCLPAPQSTTFCFNQVKLLCPSLTTEPCPKSIAKAPEQHQGTRPEEPRCWMQSAASSPLAAPRGLACSGTGKTNQKTLLRQLGGDLHRAGSPPSVSLDLLSCSETNAIAKSLELRIALASRREGQYWATQDYGIVLWLCFSKQRTNINAVEFLWERQLASVSDCCP